ncbi:right-handed parallel beta-helix repeat-containing protein [Haladaptatus caseinilyticus]|uniref:right-handed parallel beta-helix repeat-containing protein n=1 Tax=Haladaptatus caseinilyticus TaxID=2993314 RepID=UPI00224A8EB7|nr:right-handed parallel beta-helix repeat-containing protein [Haladaptatus caseinilyticus]
MGGIPRRGVLRRTAGLALAFAGRDVFATTPEETKAGRFADAVITTTSALESAFNDLSAGDTVVITGENAPYRTTQWLDIDVDGVTVVGPDIPTLVKPADGANVGGFRIGHHDHCENVTIRGVGYDGNPDGQRPSAKLCHGIVVKDAENVTLSGNYLTRTHPYHEHGTGGSGISAEKESRNVRILGNRIRDIGDRGIQVGGANVLVSGNVVTDGLDRSISCDVWRGFDHQQARNVAIVGNVLGNNLEGSLTGIGGNDLQAGGYILIASNIGFGYHKSFCHVGFGGRARNVRIDGNVSVQEESADFAGVSLNIERATNVTVVDNDLYDYGGTGVNIEKGISDFVVARNGLYDVGSDGIRITGAKDGIVARNTVSETGRAGILLDDARYVAVEHNDVRGAQRSGIVSRGNGTTNHEISENRVRKYGRSDGYYQGILLQTRENVVRGNRIYRSGGGLAIVETDGGGDNCYSENWADGTSPWRIESATSLVRGHVPAFDVHRGVVGDDAGTVSVRFDKSYARRPKLTFGRVGGGIETVSYTKTKRGAFDGVTITVESSNGVLDVFVESV